LKITIAKNAGFCFGVKRAYDLACVNSKYCDDIYILGKLVHNNDVCTDLKKRGIKEVLSIDDARDATIIFTAHGIGPEMYEKAQNNGLKVIDTTCPKVMKAQRLAKAYAEKGFQIIIFGDKEHKEVKSIFEWSGKKAKIVGSLQDAKKLRFYKSKKYCLISQTTQNVQDFKKIRGCLKNKLPHFVFFNTICDSTDKRQKEVRELSGTNNVVIVIGGKDSANSKRLYEISKSIQPKTFFVENSDQLRRVWFSGAKKIAITAGASTPDWAIKKVFKKIRNRK
jgi:(E)-4-hydroxy-3-methyl-but-2-enyl pyrophosphate reductase